MNHIQHFKDRLEYEGRGELWASTLNKHKAEVNIGEATRRTLQELGYQGVKEEKRLAAIRAANPQPKPEPPKPVDDYDAIFESLPPSATPAEELEWISSHVLMDKVASDPENVPAVKKHHIIGAPSRAAVVSLKGWLLDPAGFQTARMSQIKKHIDAGKEENKVNADPGCAEIERMLKEMLPKT